MARSRWVQDIKVKDESSSDMANTSQVFEVRAAIKCTTPVLSHEQTWCGRKDASFMQFPYCR